MNRTPRTCFRILHLPILLAAGTLLAQTGFEEVMPVELFSNEGMALVSQIKQGTGRNLIVANATIRPENGADIFLQELDVNGSVVHSNVIGNLDYHDVAKEVVQVGDAYFMAGYTRSADTTEAHTFTAFLMKVDTTLGLVWERNFILPGEELYANGITATDDGHLLMVGQIYDGSAFQTCVMKADTTGELLWLKQYVIDNSEKFTCIRELADGSIMLSGSVTLGFELSLPIACRLDASGQVMWGKKFNYPPVSVVERSDFEYIRPLLGADMLLAGNTDVKGAGGEDIYLVHIDTAGTVLDAHTYGGPQFEQPYGFNFDDATHQLHVQGTSGSFQPSFEPQGFAMRISTTGDLLGAALYGDTAAHQPVNLYHFTRLTSTCSQIAGARLSPADDIYVTSIDNMGNNGCNAYPVQPTAMPQTTTTGPFEAVITEPVPLITDIRLEQYNFSDASYLCIPTTDVHEVGPNTSGSLFPNPGNGEIAIDARSTFHPVRIVVRDALGRVVLRKEGTTNILDLPSGTAPGVFMISMEDATGERITVRYELQR